MCFVCEVFCTCCLLLASCLPYWEVGNDVKQVLAFLPIASTVDATCLFGNKARSLVILSGNKQYTIHNTQYNERIMGQQETPFLEHARSERQAYHLEVRLLRRTVYYKDQLTIMEFRETAYLRRVAYYREQVTKPYRRTAYNQERDHLVHTINSLHGNATHSHSTKH